MEQQAVITIEGLVKVYRGGFSGIPVKALKGISFDIHRGEVFGLLGPNGSGKTTTIKILLGLLFATAGKCTIFGREPSNVEVKKRIGFLPEESYLYRFLNAYETLDFYGALSGMPRKLRRERARKLIDMVGLSEAADRPLKGYSKGMSRRIGLAAALISDPELVILDEPTSGLDPIGNREIKDLILRMKGEGKTVLLCSHLLADVEDVCDRISILSRGELAANGPVSELLSRTDRFELVLESMTDEEIAELRQFVSERQNKKVFGATHPRRKLEDLFLEVVMEREGRGNGKS
ncbi:MAG: ABC transporter ATP-binding protein [Planctomycetota bacterium]|nr:ABC transporter ATP-binding protein [Planctomycetota bacterium]